MGNIKSEIDAENGRIVYQYDLEDNLLSITNEIGERLEVSYDENYNETSTTSFDGKRCMYEVDANGRRKAIVDGMGRRTDFTYQGDADVRTQTFFDGTVYKYDLNEDGRNSAISSTPPAGSSEPERNLEFAYDANGNVALVKTGTIEVQYEWDLCNHLVGIRDSSGDETLLIRGARHRVERIIDSNRQFDFEYLPNGQITSLTYPNRLHRRLSTTAPEELWNVKCCHLPAKF